MGYEIINSSQLPQVACFFGGGFCSPSVPTPVKTSWEPKGTPPMPPLQRNMALLRDY